MVRSTGAGAYSRNSLGVVIVFGMAVSTVLGRFVIPVYFVLGERLIDFVARRGGRPADPRERDGEALLLVVGGDDEGEGRGRHQAGLAS